MSRAITEKLLYLLSAHGEMSAREFLSHVPRPRGDYLDFYLAATLLHAGYVSTDTTTSGAGEKAWENSASTLMKPRMFSVNTC
jgi:hypothetical protein